MSLRDDAIILDRLRAGRLAIEFLGDTGQLEFERDLKTQASVQHQLMLLGEGVKRLSDAFLHEHADVPWRAMAGTSTRTTTWTWLRCGPLSRATCRP